MHETRDGSLPGSFHSFPPGAVEDAGERASEVGVVLQDQGIRRVSRCDLSPCLDVGQGNGHFWPRHLDLSGADLMAAGQERVRLDEQLVGE
jgi:hypothetical protein